MNVELLPHVHDNGDVSMHIDLDISTVSGHVNLGGIDQPIIGQRKVTHDIRMHEGEVNLLGGLINQQDSKQVTGIPGLSSIPLLRRLFTGESIARARRTDDRADSARRARARNHRGESPRNRGRQPDAIKLNYSPKPTDVVNGPAAAAALQPAGRPARSRALCLPSERRPLLRRRSIPRQGPCPANPPAGAPAVSAATAPPVPTPATPSLPRSPRRL